MFLDCNLTAKLGDIGLLSLDGWRTTACRQQPQRQADSAVGTWAYLAPEVKAEGRSPTACSNAYALGLSLLQLVMCREPRDIIKACQQALEDCRLQQVVDPLAGSWDLAVAERMLKLGLWCCMHDLRSRPPMSLVHQELARLLALVQSQHGAAFEAG